MSRAGIVLVGLGETALTAHLPALLRHPAVSVAGLVDPVDRRRVLAQERVRAPAFGDVTPFLDDPAVDGFILATPPWVTPALLDRLVRSGRFVLTGQVLATTSRAARPLSALPTEFRSRVQTGLAYRHDPALAVLRDWITRGKLGDSLLVRAHVYGELRDRFDPKHTERIEAALVHGMPVLHEGSHVFDWLSYLFDGGPRAVEDTWAFPTRSGLAQPNVCGARLVYPKGTVVLAEFGWLASAFPHAELSVVGDRGHARLDIGNFVLDLITAEGAERVEFEPDHRTRCFDLQLERFVELITGVRTEPTPDLADGLAALALSERIANLARGLMG
ncbi:Gfo/Idh/MocA family protein [Amycolatopsis sp. NPDC059657]|uniref:Gfo/Idh/MocA family protein n=1 Tax=Amycolatopsis sp. NPDC059657 TaxID=3346899 RepID=UPI003670A56D